MATFVGVLNLTLNFHFSENESRSLLIIYYSMKSCFSSISNYTVNPYWLMIFFRQDNWLPTKLDLKGFQFY